MQVRLVRGPLDGEVIEVDDDRGGEGAAIYWPPDRRAVDEPDVPGDVGVVEYLSRGDGTAEYVSGTLRDDASDPGARDAGGPSTEDRG